MVVDSLIIIAPIVCGGSVVLGLCFAMQYLMSFYFCN